MKIALYGLAILLLLLVTLRLLVWFVEPRMTFYPSRQIVVSPADLGVAFQERQIETVDGEVVVAWHFPRPLAQAQILFFHGNGGNLSTWLDFLLELGRHNYVVTALDYRGYGRSSGSPSEKGLQKDARAFLQDYYSELHDPSKPTIYFGRSLGGVFAAYASSVREPDGLILEATFSDKSSLLKHYPVLRVMGWFSGYKLSTRTGLQTYDGPVLVIHGDRDRVVPLEVGRELFSLIDSEKYFYEIAGSGHNDQHLVGGDSYWKEIATFVSRIERGDSDG